ncbi:MAG TPA: NmrA/HSCARG family protein [Gemmatimonadaceae bacterium]|nr:NmrA/HSCARG family protein [Gemmatimonadaceae bacterium]
MSTSAKSERTIVVTGATGKQGGAVARELLRRGFRVRAITRDPSKPAARALAELGADVVRGDLDDPESLRPSVGGAYGVFSVQNFWEVGYDREVAEGIALAELASEVGVEHFVYDSVGSAHRETGLSHFESKWKIEERIRALDLPYTIFRPVYFMDNWENPALRSMILGGTLALPLDPDRELQEVATRDIGAFVGMAFADREAWLGRELDLAGDELSMSKTAESFGRVIGRPVNYVQVPWEKYRELAGEEYAEMFRWFELVGYEADIEVLRELYPGLTTLEQYLRAHGWEGAAS